MQERAPPPAARGEALRENVQDLRERFLAELSVGPGPPNHGQELIFAPLPAGSGRGHDLLCKDVERPFGNFDPVELAALDAAHQGGAFDEVVTAHWKESAFRSAAVPVPRAPDTLHKGCDRVRRAELADQVHIPNVDPQLERCSGHHGAELAGLQTPLGIEPVRSGEAAVMRGDRILADELAQVSRDALCKSPCVYENQGGLVTFDQRRQFGVDLLPDFERHDRFERRAWQLDSQVHFALVPDVDDSASGGGVVPCDARTNQETSHLFDWVLRRRQADPRSLASDQGLEPFQRKRQVRPALVGHHGVNFVDDDRAHVREHPPSPIAGEQDVERLRGCHEDLRRLLHHLRSHVRGGVAGTYGRSDLHVVVAELCERSPNPLERCLEVLFDVVAEGLEG